MPFARRLFLQLCAPFRENNACLGGHAQFSKELFRLSEAPLLIGLECMSVLFGELDESFVTAFVAYLDKFERCALPFHNYAIDHARLRLLTER
jgi:hypothetical protein